MCVAMTETLSLCKGRAKITMEKPDLAIPMDSWFVMQIYSWYERLSSGKLMALNGQERSFENCNDVQRDPHKLQI